MQQAFDDGEELSLLEAHVVDQCLPRLGFAFASCRIGKQPPQRRMLAEQSLGKRSLAPLAQQGDEPCFLFSEMRGKRILLRTQNRARTAFQQPAADAQRAVPAA